MPETQILGTGPSVRVSAGGGSQQRSQELLQVARESDASVAAAVGSTGHEALEPLVTATRDGETAFYPRCSIERLRSVLAALDDGDLPADDATAVVQHDPGTSTLPVPEGSPLAVGERTVLGPCGWTAPASVADYRATGAPLPLDVDGEDALSRLEETGLRGRGRGDASTDEPVVDDWATVRAAEDDPAVVVNGNDAADHAGGDRLLLESAPLSVLVPAVAAADVLDASDVVVHVNETDDLARERVEAAAAALADELDDPVPIRTVEGPDEYKAGEPTMALEAVEGKHRIEARRRPPGPDEYGLDGRPTLVHTPRTMAQVGRCLAGDDLGGVPSDPGTRLFSVGGDVEEPATVELSTDSTLDVAVGAVDAEDGHRAACVGGTFGGLTRSLDVPANASGLSSAGLGTNGVVELVGESTCIVALAGERAKFAKDENCGRCAPCREGSKQLLDLLRDVYDGEFEDDMLRELGRTMRESSLCGFGRDASRPVTTAMEAFETEFDAHANGRCPTGTCSQL